MENAELPPGSDSICYRGYPKPEFGAPSPLLAEYLQAIPGTQLFNDLGVNGAPHIGGIVTVDGAKGHFDATYYEKNSDGQYALSITHNGQTDYYVSDTNGARAEWHRSQAQWQVDSKPWGHESINAVLDLHTGNIVKELISTPTGRHFAYDVGSDGQVRTCADMTWSRQKR